MKISGVILAGGRGSRMESELPKPLHVLGDKTLLEHTVDKLNALQVDQKIIVVGWKAEQIIEKHSNLNVEWVIQPHPLGNGDALKCGLTVVSENSDLILSLHADDSAFYKHETLQNFITTHALNRRTVSFMTVEKPDITPRFRVHKTQEGQFLGFEPLGEIDRTQSIEFFTGCACFQTEWLRANISTLEPSEAVGGEFSLHTLFIKSVQMGENTGVYKLANSNEWGGVNTAEQLREANLRFRSSKERL